MNISKFQQLDYFLEKGRIPRLDLLDRDSIGFEYGFFLGIENGFPLHKASSLPAQSLRQAWEKTNEYICNLIEYLESHWGNEVEYRENFIDLFLDNEILYDLRNEFLQPPTVCCPIYIITVGTGDSEEVVYIGKTSAKNNRFKGGHSVALKLHNPKYDGLQKNIYFASVMLLGRNQEYIPLEFVSNLRGAEKLLLEIEASLIYNINPELNILNTNRANYNINSQIHIQNFSEYSNFLHDECIVI